MIIVVGCLHEFYVIDRNLLMYNCSYVLISFSHSQYQDSIPFLIFTTFEREKGAINNYPSFIV